MAFFYNFLVIDGAVLMTCTNPNFNKIYDQPVEIDFGFNKFRIRNANGKNPIIINKENIGEIDVYTVTEEDSMESIAFRLKNALPSATDGIWNIIADFTIGDGQPNTPLVGGTVYLDPTLANVGDSKVKIYQDGNFLVFGNHYNLTEGGGFNLINDYTFEASQRYIIWKKS